MMNEEHSFYVQAFYNGGINSFEVIPNGDNYHIAADGNIIANYSMDTTGSMLE